MTETKRRTKRFGRYRPAPMSGERTRPRRLPRWVTDPIRPIRPLPSELVAILREPTVVEVPADDEESRP